MRGHSLFLRFSSFFSRIFSTKLNPFFHLGTIAFYLFSVAFVSGIYLFFVYNVDPTQAYQSTEALSRQWVGGFMRNIHRYSSDALVVFIVLHLIHMLITGKFKRVKSWIFGILSFVITLFIGLTGFVLVWDQKAKLLGVLTAKLFIALPIFDPSMAGAFMLGDLAYLGGFFRVTLFGHIFFSAFTLLFLWIHVIHLNKFKIFPPKPIMWFSTLFLTIISIVYPVVSDPPAQESILPTETTFDWYYFFGYYFMKLFSVTTNWILVLFAFILFISIPFLFKKRKVDIPDFTDELCDGCEQCVTDCPYEAIEIHKVNEEDKAKIDPSKCVGCGICVGSCKTMAFTFPEYPNPMDELLQQKKKVILYTCKSLPKTTSVNHSEVKHEQVRCIGDLNARMTDQLIPEKAEGMMMVACENCFYRFGSEWAEERFNRNRRPLMRNKVPFDKVRMVKGTGNLKGNIDEFISDLEVEDKAPKSKEIKVKGYVKPRYILAGVLGLLFFLAIPLISTSKIKFYDKKEALMIFNFKYISGAIMSDKSTGSHASHMQSNVPTVERRSPIRIEVKSENTGEVFYSKVTRPPGLREDVAIYVYDEVKIEGSVTVTLTELDFPETQHVITSVQAIAGDATVIEFKNKQLEIRKREID